VRRSDLPKQTPELAIRGAIHGRALLWRGDSGAHLGPAAGVDALSIIGLRGERGGLLLQGALADVRLQVLLQHRAARGEIRRGLGSGAVLLEPTQLGSGDGGGAYWEGSTGQGTRRPAPAAVAGRWLPQYLRKTSQD
jgi:hypothetical protein